MENNQLLRSSAISNLVCGTVIGTIDSCILVIGLLDSHTLLKESEAHVLFPCIMCIITCCIFLKNNDNLPVMYVTVVQCY